MVLDQFTLGKKVDNETATNLPVKLALALLKDRDGKIVMSLPVEGDINSPQFSFGGIVWTVCPEEFFRGDQQRSLSPQPGSIHEMKYCFLKAPACMHGFHPSNLFWEPPGNEWENAEQLRQEISGPVKILQSQLD